MPKPVSPTPAGFHSITPYIVVKDAAKAIDFYHKAFGAEEIMRMPGPDGRVMHAEVKIGDSILMLADEFPEQGHKAPQPNHTSASLHVYVPDVDTAYQRAVAAGCTSTVPVTDMFWGDRYGKLKDPFGHVWGLATHKEDLTPDQIAKRAATYPNA